MNAQRAVVLLGCLRSAACQSLAQRRGYGKRVVLKQQCERRSLLDRSLTLTAICPPDLCMRRSIEFHAVLSHRELSFHSQQWQQLTSDQPATAKPPHNMSPRAALATTTQDPSPHVLNKRRRDVLDLLCRGLTNAEIGQQLGIGSRTVKWYVSQLLVKYEATNRTELVGIVLSGDRAS